MTLRREYKLGQSEFNDFLFALVGEEENGQEITVLSAFSRLGLDPWGEAARLSSLSKAAATESLMGTIATLPDGNWQPADRQSIAARLVASLPKGRSLGAKSGVGHQVRDRSAKGDAQTERSPRIKLGREMNVETLLKSLELPNWLVWLLLIVAVLFVLSRLYADTNYGSGVYTDPSAVQQHSVVVATRPEQAVDLSAGTIFARE